MFTRKKLKGIATFVLFHLIIPLLLVTALAAPASAATAAATTGEGLTTDDALKGLAIALGIIVIAKFAKAMLQDTRQETQVSAPPVDKTAPVGYTDSDLELLARVIYAESRGEPYEGQVAVGAVILNRVKSSQFPNTIREVIYAPNQFTSVTDGQINLKPNETAYKAAREALAGKDPSLGALFFYNPKTARTLSWLSTRPTTVVIGNHVFAK